MLMRVGTTNVYPNKINQFDYVLSYPRILAVCLVLVSYNVADPGDHPAVRRVSIVAGRIIFNGPA